MYKEILSTVVGLLIFIISLFFGNQIISKKSRHQTNDIYIPDAKGINISDFLEESSDDAFDGTHAALEVTRPIVGGFANSDDINDPTFVQIDLGNISYQNVRNNLATNINTDLLCSTSTSDGNSSVYDVVNNLNTTCAVAKSGVMTPDYKLTYMMRDWLTTTYVRSLEAEGAKNKINAKLYAIQLADTFNKILSNFNNHFSQLSPSCILYKGGNIINIYTTMLHQKLRNETKNNKFEAIRFELKRGDWDYALHMGSNNANHTDTGRTYVLRMLEKVKEYMDNTQIFDIRIVANNLLSDINNGALMPIFREYFNATRKKIEFMGAHLPGVDIVNNRVTPGVTTLKHSGYTMPRPNDTVNDSFEVRSLSGDGLITPTQISIGFTEGIRFRMTNITNDFDLARVKINNIFDLRINGKRDIKTLSADIIDMSFINPGDTRTIWDHDKMDPLKLDKYTYRMVHGFNIPFLTPHYLFYDLCAIIFEGSVYPWDDKKYNKRLARLTIMGLISSIIAGNMDIDKLFKIISSFLGNSPEDVYANFFKESAVVESDGYIRIHGKFSHFSYEILRGIYKCILYDEYSKSQNLNAFIRTNAIFILTGESPINIKVLSNRMDVGKFKEFIETLHKILKFYANTETVQALRKIKFDDKESIDIGSL